MGHRKSHQRPCIIKCLGGVKLHGGKSYIGMPPDLLYHLIIEVTGVAQEMSAELVGVLDTCEHRTDISLLQLNLGLLMCQVDVVYPAAMLGSNGFIDMLLELDNI